MQQTLGYRILFSHNDLIFGKNIYLDWEKITFKFVQVWLLYAIP